jgi:hypothetical protein
VLALRMIVLMHMEFRPPFSFRGVFFLLDFRTIIILTSTVRD